MDFPTVKQDIRKCGLSEDLEKQILLQYWPEPLDGFRSRMPLGQGTSGIDIAVLIQRLLHVYEPRHLRDPDRSANPEQAEELRRQEAAGPLLQYPWHYIPIANQGDDVDADVVALQNQLIAAVMDHQELSRYSLTFNNIMESSFMLENFWKRPQWSLFRPYDDVKKVDENGPWETQPNSPIRCAEFSLVRWTGEKSLGTFISSMFSEEITSGTIVRKRVLGWPLCIRVQLDPLKAVPFSNILSFILRVQDLNAEDEEDEDQTLVQRFNLAAVVRMRNRDNEDDYVRLYGLDGKYVVPPFSSGHAPVSYINDTWSLIEHTLDIFKET